MKTLQPIAALLGILLLGAGSLETAAEAQRRPSQQRRAAAVNWLQRVERTAEGGYRIGNPNAAVKLVEYGSITCPHCAAFAREADQPLRQNHIRSGRVSYEYRPVMLFPSDPGIFLLLGCQGPAGFFDTVHQLYMTRDNWASRIQAQQARLAALPVQQRVGAVVRAAGVDQLFRQRGMSPQRINACLSDQAALRRLVENNRRYAGQGVTATPTFLVNGRRADVGSWAELESLLR